MSLSQLALSEPLVSAMVTLLKANLNATIDTLNATITDGYKVDHVVQFLPYVPVPSTLEAGMPAVGIQRLGATFQNDLEYSTEAEHEYAVVIVVQNADQAALAWQLDRSIQAIANTIQADRMQGTPQGSGGVLRNQGGAWSVNLGRVEPGPLLADLNPEAPEAAPRAYLSWSALTLASMRTEI